MIRMIFAATAALGLSLAPALAQDAPKVKGTVEKVDDSAEKITLSHGPIPNLDDGKLVSLFSQASHPFSVRRKCQGVTNPGRNAP